MAICRYFSYHVPRCFKIPQPKLDEAKGTVSQVGALLSKGFPCLFSHSVDALSGLTVPGLVGEAVTGLVLWATRHRDGSGKWALGRLLPNPGASPRLVDRPTNANTNTKYTAWQSVQPNLNFLIR